MPIFTTLDTAIALLKRFWWAIPILALSIALLATRATLADAKRDLQAEQTAHQQTIQNYRTAAAERKAADLANVQRVKAEGDAISRETIDDYQKRIDALRASFAERVRIATAGDTGSAAGTDMSGLSDAAGQTDAAACKAGLPERDALIASEQAEQLIALQAWVAKVAAIDTNGERPQPRESR
jgi:hypothetical protein